MRPNRGPNIRIAASQTAVDAASCDGAVSAATAPESLTVRLRRWRRHFSGPGDVISFLAIGAALLYAPRSLARRGLPQTLAHLHARGRPALGRRCDEAAILARAQRLARYADVWLRRLRLANPCLRRTLVLYGRLRRAGLPVHFCLGVRPGPALSDDGLLDGHAWLELDEQPFLERSPLPAEQVTTFRYPATAG
jgi:hypothetical protein